MPQSKTAFQVYHEHVLPVQKGYLEGELLFGYHEHVLPVQKGYLEGGLVRHHEHVVPSAKGVFVELVDRRNGPQTSLVETGVQCWRSVLCRFSSGVRQ
jgi:hypothetical protein